MVRGLRLAIWARRDLDVPPNQRLASLLAQAGHGQQVLWRHGQVQAALAAFRVQVNVDDALTHPGQSGGGVVVPQARGLDNAAEKSEQVAQPGWFWLSG